MSKFIKGADLSTMLELEACGAKYYVNGQETDILDIMKNNTEFFAKIMVVNE